ncbi:MAG: hemerythrin domain-containing protein [Planctomycetota bacterium]
MSDPDLCLADFFKADHRACDAAWTEVEEAVEEGDAATCKSAFERYDRIQRRHLRMEEEVMFPAFEKRSGMTQGPTQVMRMEHQQMRGVLEQMAQAVAGSDFQELLDQGDTLLMLIQQHNQKEEGILYPMADKVLAAEWNVLRERLAEL